MTHFVARTLTILTVACAVLVAGGPTPLRAQDGLVLSAGGSRGLAHVGVLMALDSLDRDPNVVVGASMGAVVGALYASGHSSATIRRLVTGMDWDDLFRQVPLPLGFDRAIHDPTWQWAVDLAAFEFSRGLRPDWRANRMLVRLLADAGIRARGDFDRLPRRFRAVTADFETGEQVVLGAGDLPRAVRASMAQPGFFSPVAWDSRVLTDGAVADYLPVSVARQLGADTVIAVDIMRPKHEMGSRDPVSLAFRGLGLVTVNAHPKTDAPDILITPDVPQELVGLVFPEDVSPLIEQGFTAAYRRIPPGRRKQVARQPARAPDSLAALVIETPDPAIAALARRIFRNVAPARYDIRSALDAADRLYATGVANGVWLRVDDGAQLAANDSTYPRHAGVADGEVSRSSPGLVVTVDPPPTMDAAVGAGYDNDRGGRIWAALVGRLPAERAPLELEFAASANGISRWGSLGLRRHSLAMAPLRWVAGVHAADRIARFVPVDAGVTQQQVRRTGGSLGIELPHIYPDWLLSATVRGEHVRLLDGGGPRGASFGPWLSIAIPTTDPFAQETDMQLEARFGDVAYRRAIARGALHVKRGGTRLAAVLDLAVVSGESPPDVIPSLGDHRAMPGFRWGEERGRTRIVTGLDVAQPLLPFQGKARARLRFGSAVDDAGDLGFSGNWVTGAEIGGSWSLPLASLFVGVGMNSRGKQRLDVSIGPRF